MKASPASSGVRLAGIEIQNLARADVAALAESGELREIDAKNLQDQLNATRAAIQRGRDRLAILSLNAFELQLASLTLRQLLDFDVALSLGLAAEALETWLEQGLRQR